MVIYLRIPNLGPVYVAPDTAVYCRGFILMDVFHDVDKEVVLAVLEVLNP